MHKVVVFDFDSTLVAKESLDEVLKLACNNDLEIMSQIQAITIQGMEGEIDLKTSLERRFALASPTKKHFDQIGQELTQYISPGIRELINYLRSQDCDVHIVSGGFLPCILPTAKVLNIPENHCHGEALIKKEAIKVIRNQYPHPIEITALGDGYTDLELYLQGAVEHFIGYGIHVIREKVQKKAPLFISDPDELLRVVKTII